MASSYLLYWRSANYAPTRHTLVARKGGHVERDESGDEWKQKERTSPSPVGANVIRDMLMVYQTSASMVIGFERAA